MLGEINVKVIIRDGIVSDVLADETRLPINVEIVDVNKDYKDYADLDAYAKKLCNDPEYGSADYRYADFIDHL